MSYGSSEWRPWVLDERQAQPFFKRAIEAGINFFDTADFYSAGRSEEITGTAPSAMRPHRKKSGSPMSLTIAQTTATTEVPAITRAISVAPTVATIRPMGSAPPLKLFILASSCCFAWQVHRVF